jgi:hypothetical protein
MEFLLVHPGDPPHLAHKIVELAKAGERDPERLCDRVLMQFRQP